MRRLRPAFTLIELLVVIAIISLLIGMILAAVQRVRDSGLKSQCQNNLKQIGIAVNNYEVSMGSYPASMYHQPGTVFASNNGSWSIHGRILPYIEQNTLQIRVNLAAPWDAQGNTGVPTTRVPLFVCPSEINDQVRVNASGAPLVYPQNYGFNFGTWFVYDPSTGIGGDGMFFPNSRLRPGHLRDGASQTLCAAEVKAFTPYVRNTPDPGFMPPTDPSSLAAFGISGQRKLGPNTNDNTGHTEWPDGRVHHSGITTTFNPNTVVPFTFQGKTYDIDFNSRQEGSSATQRTYAAITSRSYHIGGQVNILLMDGSVRSVHQSISPQIWRALGTRDGEDIVDDY